MATCYIIALVSDSLAGKAANKHMINAVSQNQNSTYSQVLLGKALRAVADPCVCAPAASLSIQRIVFVLFIWIVFSSGA
jgi:hypothetical protein